MKKIYTLFFLLTLAFGAAAQEKSKFQVVNFLNSISGRQTLSGTHNNEPNARPALRTNRVDSISGHFPALWSGDFLFQRENIDNRQVMIDEAVRQWKKGAVINIMWHACNPASEEPCGWDNGHGVLSRLTDEQWKQLTTDGSELNKIWKARVDEVCFYLQQLKEKNIEVLWRPMHEMNINAFWWAGRPGPEGTIKLYRMLHDYMVYEKKLTNLIWVWDIQDLNTLTNDALVYRPDPQYWDVAALDVYDKSGYTEAKYQTMLQASGGKPIAIGECEVFPSSEQLRVQPKWTFFMVWSDQEFKCNTPTQIKAIHTAPNVLTLDKMPGWK